MGEVFQRVSSLNNVFQKQYTATITFAFYSFANGTHKTDAIRLREEVNQAEET